MKDLTKGLKQNKGFSLIELLVAIAIVSIMTVPLLQSFLVSARTTKTGRTLQNAQAVAQIVLEKAKRVSSLDELDEAYKAAAPPVLAGSDNVEVISTETGGRKYHMNKYIGADGMRFDVDVTVEPTEHKYMPTSFSDVLTSPNVIFSELVQFDSNILNLLRNTPIPYGETAKYSALSDEASYSDIVVTRPVKYKLSAANVWEECEFSDADKNIRVTYGNLLADESVDNSSGKYPFGDYKFLKGNVEKYVDIQIKKTATGYDVTISPVFLIRDYEVIYMAETELTVPGVPGGGGLPAPEGGAEPAEPSEPADPALAFYKYKGNMIYKPDPIEITLPELDSPVYMLYAKSTTSIDFKDPRAFNKERYYITVTGTNLSDTIDLYMISQGDGNSENCKFSVGAVDTQVLVRTNEAKTDTSGNLVITPTSVHVKVQNDKPDDIMSDTVAYTRKKKDNNIDVDEEVTLYTIKVDVFCKGKLIYSVNLE